MNKMLYKAATWSISLYFQGQQQKPTNQVKANNITIYDNICLKSVNNTYLGCKNNLECLAMEEIDHERSVWNMMKSDALYTPNWIYSRSTFSKYMNISNVNEELYLKEKKPLKAHSAETQETLLVEDLIDVMMGFDGLYIKVRHNSFQFNIEPHLENPSCLIALAQLSNRILELPTCAYKVEQYISIYSIQQGVVCQALCGGLRTLVKEYKCMVLQLEGAAKDGLSLQMMWYHVQSGLKVMRALVDLISDAQKLKGGKLLSCITRLLNSNTDETIVRIYNFLFMKIITLYVKMLSKWIYQGVVEDKHEEFMIMVEEEKNLSNDWNYWEQKYVLRNDQIPTLFEKSAHTLLVTGKYLNILKVMGTKLHHPFAKQIESQLEPFIIRQDWTDPINKAYQWANQQLLNVIFKECRLKDVLKSMKGYYFMEYGDLFVHFMDASEEDLLLYKKAKVDSKAKHFSMEKIQNLFELLVRTSSANKDEFKDDISCKIDNMSIYEQVTRIKTLESEAFNYNFEEKAHVKKDSRYVDYLTLDFKCKFPLNLIINKKSISKYQTMFRFMFWCKFTQRQLNSTWLTLQATKEIPLDCYRQAYFTNYNMINFIKNLLYYMCEEVIEHNWNELMGKLKSVKNFEEIIKLHNDFLNKVLTESLLINNKLLPMLTADMNFTFHQYFTIKSYLSKIYQEKQFIFVNISSIQQQNAGGDHLSLIHRKRYMLELQGIVKDFMDEKNFIEFISKISFSFDEELKKFLKEMYSMVGKQQSYIVRLLERIDEVNFYNKKLFKSSIYGI